MAQRWMFEHGSLELDEPSVEPIKFGDLTWHQARDALVTDLLNLASDCQAHARNYEQRAAQIKEARTEAEFSRYTAIPL